MHFETAALSKKGGRSHNEDYLGYKEQKDGYCWVLADGLGGHEFGEVASRLVVESILNSFAADPSVSLEALQAHFGLAHETLLNQQQTSGRRSGYKSTIVSVVADSSRIVWGHVGDSRFYLIRDGSILFQTKDHSVAQAMVNANEITQEEVRFNEDRNRLLQVAGSDGKYKPAFAAAPYAIKAGDAFLLCTDGFWEYVTEVEMEVDLAKSDSPQGWLAKMESMILNRQLQNNDNYSAVAVFIRR